MDSNATPHSVLERESVALNIKALCAGFAAGTFCTPLGKTISPAFSHDEREYSPGKVQGSFYWLGGGRCQYCGDDSHWGLSADSVAFCGDETYWQTDFCDEESVLRSMPVTV